MIRQQVGDVLEINFGNKWYYVVILTKAAMFGGNIVFAYHNDGKKMQFEQLKDMIEGFNICTDLLQAKKQGLVKRIGKTGNVKDLFKSEFAKGTNEDREGVRATRWYIYDIHKLGRHIKVVGMLPEIYKNAMYLGTFSFDLVAEKIFNHYTPSQDEHI